MNKVIYLSIAVICFILVPVCVMSTSTINKSINLDVQVQENGWLKIVNSFVTVQTPDEFWHNSAVKDESQKEKFIKHDNDNGRIYRKVFVNLQFLKPCKASVLRFGVDDPEIEDPTADEMYGGLLDTNFTMPKYRCNYRVKVFITLFDRDGNEIKVIALRPPARSRKAEIIPGEKTQVHYIIPDQASSWYVWLPK